jgi:hypothetical protein
MPGWVRGHEQGKDDSGSGSPEAGGVDARGDAHAASAVRALGSQTTAPAIPSKSTLTQSQRDELIAEILGDVVALSDQVKQVAEQVQALGQALTANDFVRWRNTLDLKMSELADVNLSEQSAKRLGSFAQAYIEQLSRETNTMVTLQAKRAVGDTLAFNQLFDKLNRDWLMRLGTIATVCCVSTLLGHILWSIW